MVKPFLSTRDLSRSYGPIAALTGISIDFLPGEVHAVVGENGAGKSTLMRLLAGEEQPDRGEILIEGQPALLRGPTDAHAQGIAIVHQNFQFATPMTVAENMFLRQPPTWLRVGPLGLLDREKMRRQSKQRLAEFGLAHKVDHRIRDLTIAERQLVEIARAMDERARLMILDEPTASLGVNEIEELFRHIAEMSARGAAIILIAHNIDEVMEVSDRISVLRNGCLVATQHRSAVDYNGVVRMIVGRELARGYPKADVIPGPSVLRAKGIINSQGERSIEIRESEILGIPTYIGSMVEDVLDALAGLKKPRGMVLTLADSDISRMNVRQRVAAGICLIPGDAIAEGLIPSFSIEDNILVPNMAKWSKGGIVRRRALRQIVEELIQKLDIKPSDPSTPVKRLSGGNRQKVVIAKWLASGARIFLMNDPTKAVDVGAKAEIYRLLGDVVAAGGSVLFVSSDMDELVGLSDRVLVLRGMQLIREFPGRPIEKQDLLAAVIGSRSYRVDHQVPLGPDREE